MHLRSPLLAVLGLVAVGAVALQLLSGGVTLGQAAVRVALAIGILAVVDRVGVPLARALVGPGRTPEDGTPPAP